MKRSLTKAVHHMEHTASVLAQFLTKCISNALYVSIDMYRKFAKLLRWYVLSSPGKSLKNYLISNVSTGNQYCVAGNILPTSYWMSWPGLDNVPSLTTFLHVDYRNQQLHHQRCVACLHAKTLKGHFAASLFCWIVILISCIRPLLYLALWTSSCVTCQFGCSSQHLTHGTGYKHMWPLCQKHVTRLVNYPATLCISCSLLL
jgi:hypothetical protein